MKDTIYLFSDGELKRKDNSLMFWDNEGNKKYIPVENIKEIFAFGEVTINKKLLEFLAKKEIMLSYFNYYGYYTGTFYPREHYNSGYVILKQAQVYMDEMRRLFLAKKFIEGSAKNKLRLLRYYNRRERDLETYIGKIEELLESLPEEGTIEQSMALEGKIAETYYSAFDEIANSEDFRFEKRTKRPPKNYMNCLISFGNSLIYTYCLNEIYQTHLDPRIGFLHTTNFRRFTLNLDVAEIFKPIIADRVLFAVINKNIITTKDFEKGLGGIALNESGKKKYISYLEKVLAETVSYKSLKKRVSYRRLLRLELYKIEKDILDDESYQPFVMEW